MDSTKSNAGDGHRGPPRPTGTGNNGGRRQRSLSINDPFDRGPARRAANDPLAELARLIGQNDPFSEFGRDRPPGGTARRRRLIRRALQLEPSRAAVSPASRLSPRLPAARRASARRHVPLSLRRAALQSRAGRRHTGVTSAPRYAADIRRAHTDNQAGHNDWPGCRRRRRAPRSRRAIRSHCRRGHRMCRRPPPSHVNTGYAESEFGSSPSRSRRARPAAGQLSAGSSGLRRARAMRAAPERRDTPPLYPHEPAAGGMPPPHDDEFYDDAPRGGRRKGLLTVVAVLGLAVLGTAGAFGYRSMFGGTRFVGAAAGDPRQRRAEQGRAAAAHAATRRPSKFSYDRFGDAARTRRSWSARRSRSIWRRCAPPPRTVLRARRCRSLGSSVATQPCANPPSAMGEPRRVRTVPIRPDQGGTPPPRRRRSSRRRSPPRQAVPGERTAPPSRRPAAPPLRARPASPARLRRAGAGPRRQCAAVA